LGNIWTQFFLQPMINALLLLYSAVGQNFAVAIAIFTLFLRLITLPLTLPQMKSAKKMQEVQPELKALQKKYKDDKEKLAKEQMELYKRAGVNPLGGCLPMLIQFPIWIGLYQAISQALATGPLQLLSLAGNIYRGLLPALSPLVPLHNRFLWLDLSRPDPIYILPVLVVASTWFQQKVSTAPSGDAQSASMNQSMQIMMPLMLGFFSLQFSSGLALYFVISNVVGIVIQYFTPGWVGVSLGKRSASPTNTGQRERSRLAAPMLAEASDAARSETADMDDEKPRPATKKGQQQYGKKRRKRRG
jgi:YidC/Oxa1 family membrane protein insertase